MNEYQIIEFTPQVAIEWLERYYYGGIQRPINRSQVNGLARAMRRGTFTSNILTLGQVGDDLRLTNGQHTLKAVIQAGISMNLPVVVEHFETEQQRAIDYAHKDRPGRRKLVTGLVAYGVDESYGNLTRRNQFATAAKYILLGFPYTHATGRPEDFYEVAELMKSLKGPAEKFFARIAGSPLSDTLCRSDCLSIGVLTMKDRPSNATKFWGSVAFPEDPKAPQQCVKLGRWLAAPKTIPIGPRGGGGTNRMRQSGVSIAVAFRCVMQAWNAYYDNTPLRFTYDPNLPIILRGVDLAPYMEKEK